MSVKKTRNIKKIIVITTIIILTIIAVITSVGAYIVHDIQSKVKGKELVYIPQTSVIESKPATPIDSSAGTPINMVLIGVDSRDGDKKNSLIGGNEKGNYNSDSIILLHISSDRNDASVISFPRDLIVNQPSCNLSNGKVFPARKDVMINSIMPAVFNQTHDKSSAASCLVNTLSSITKIGLRTFAIVDFAGLSDLIDSVGGVDICIPQPIIDSYTKLNLKQGFQHLDGITATQYARVRHGSDSDGSDLIRTVKQQYLIKELFKKIKQQQTLSDISKIYSLTNTALNHMSLSSDLTNIATLTGLAYSMRHLSQNRIETMTIPTVPYVKDPNRVQFADNVNEIWNNILLDRSIYYKDNSSNKNSDNNNTSDYLTDEQKKKLDKQYKTDESINTAQNSFITDPDGKLIDVKTRGIIDKLSGVIKDAKTGAVIGINYDYVNTTCKALSSSLPN